MARVYREPLRRGMRTRPTHPALRHETLKTDSDSGGTGGDEPGPQSPLEEASAEQDLVWEAQVDAILEAAFND